MFTQTKDPDIVKVTGTANCYCGEWRRIRAKKAHWCILTRKFIGPNDWCYRPVSGCGYAARMQRINADAMAGFIEYDKGCASV